MRVHDSALKHGVAVDDAVCAATWAVWIATSTMTHLRASCDLGLTLTGGFSRRSCSSSTAVTSCSSIAFTGAYDVARNALAPVLAVQGLRPISVGGHLTVYGSSLVHLDPPMGKKITPFDWMRRTRSET